MPAGFGRAGARICRSKREVEIEGHNEERYRNRCITFASNIMPPGGKAIDRAKFLSAIFNRLIHFVFYEASRRPSAKKTGIQAMIC